MGSLLAFWRKGLGARSAGRQVPCKSRALSSTQTTIFNKDIVLVYVERACAKFRASSERARLRETAIFN